MRPDTRSSVVLAMIATLTGLSMAPVVHAQSDSVTELYKQIGAPGSIQRDRVVSDIRDHIARGEVSPFKVMLAEVLPTERMISFGGPDAKGSYGDKLRTGVNGRGGFSTFYDDFSSYPRSTDPVFDRFQVSMQDMMNPSGLTWDFSQTWYVPSLFVAGQIDLDDPTTTDPLPRWQGVTMVENTGLGILASDLNGDGNVDTADLGSLLGVFGSTGAPGFDPSDLNNDGVVDTADLGIMLGDFGQSAGPFCAYLVTDTHTIDDRGDLLNNTTVMNGPMAGQTIAVLNGTYTNDADADGCPDCDFFRLVTDGAVNSESVYGTWTLGDSSQTDLAGIDFMADAGEDSCSGWGDEAVFADLRSQTNIIENQCCFFGARTKTPLFTPSIGQPLIMNADFYFTSYDTFTWFDTVSSVEGFTVTRVFMGGFASSLSPDFQKYSTGGDGFINHFVFLGILPGNFCFGQFYGTAPDPLVGNLPIFIPLNRWFSLSFRLTTNNVSIWLLDEPQYVANGFVDPDATDGSGTPHDGTDDIDTQGSDHWFKLFPTGPAGASPGSADGQVPDIPQPPLKALSMDTYRFLWSGDPTEAEVPGYRPSPVFFDNLHVEGVLFPVPPLPKFALNYHDDIETYFGGGNLELMGGRWFDALSSRAVIDHGVSVSGFQSIRQDNNQTDNQYRLEFETSLPTASSKTTPWTLGVQVSLSQTGTVRSILLRDKTHAVDAFSATAARLLTGVIDDAGIIVSEPGPVPPAGSTRMHMRVPNPNFDPNIEPFTQRDIDLEPPLAPINTPFINVPTDTFWEDINVFHHFTFDVDANRNLIVRRDGVAINPDPVLAPAAGYKAPGWTARSNAITHLAFESGNQSLGFNSRIWVDDVTLDGLAPIIADGPLFALPYSEAFEDYSVDTPIDGQGATSFIDGATLINSNLCIEQGLQALNRTSSDLDDWCEYIIKSDTIGGIDPVNDWGLVDGDSIYVRQADCSGPVACKDLQCFTNPNRLDEFIPNAGLFDPSGPKSASGVRVQFVQVRAGFNPPNLLGRFDTFEWDTYDPANVFSRYTVNTIDDISNDPLNQPYYNTVGGKVIAGDIIAVDPVFGPDPGTGVTPSPGVPGVENEFKITDPCGEIILSGTWTLIGDGAGETDANPLDCADVPHFNFVFDTVDRYRTDSTDGQNTVVNDPTASGRGNVLSAINDRGSETGGVLFANVRSTYPTAYATGLVNSVFEVDCYVTNNNTRISIVFDGPNGVVTELQLGGPDEDPLNSPGEVAISSANLALLENNPGAGGPFGEGPAQWFYDTGTAVPLNAWFRIRATVTDGGAYTLAMDQSGAPGGDGVFETLIETASAGSAQSGIPIGFGADAIDGFNTNIGLDFGGDGAFNRDPIEITQNDTNLPGAFNPGYGAPPNIVPKDFCYYQIDAVDGESGGILPAPCGGVFFLNGVMALLRDAALPNWPNGGVVENCPDSHEFIWNDESMTGQCTGVWSIIDPDDPNMNNEWPTSAAQVDSWADYTTIPPYSNPGPASQWFFDSITLDGSPTP